jgi:hypothetical protein
MRLIFIFLILIISSSYFSITFASFDDFENQLKENVYYLDHQGVEVDFLLSQMGIDQQKIERGYITESNLWEIGVNAEIFKEFAYFEEDFELRDSTLRINGIVDLRFTYPVSRHVDYLRGFFSRVDFSKQEAINLQDRLQHDPNFPDLFYQKLCPMGAVGRAVFDNVYGQPDQIRAIRKFSPHKVPIETSCTRADYENQGFSASNLIGIFFIKDDKFEAIKKAVVYIESDFECEGIKGITMGSGVNVSSSGIIFTVAHIFTLDGKIRSEILKRASIDCKHVVSRVYVGNQIFPVYISDLKVLDRSADIAVLQLPGVKGILPFIPFAKKPPLETETVVAMGYPPIRDSNEIFIGNPYPPLTFSYGYGTQLISQGNTDLLKYLDLGIVSYMRSEMFLSDGNSGGAIVNEKGELIGIAAISHVENNFDQSVLGYYYLTIKDMQIYRGLKEWL